MRFALIAALLLFPLSAPAQQTDADALKLLDRVAKHYEDAESVHLEAIVKSTTHNDFYDQASTTKLSAYTASGGRFRYDGTAWEGSGLIVSDGTNEWRLMRGFRQYAKSPTGMFFASRSVSGGDNRPIIEARNLLQNIIFLTSSIRSAHFALEEDINIGDRTVHCVVVHFGSADFTGRSPDNQTSETTLWVDTKSLIVLKEQYHSIGLLSYGNKIPPHGAMLDRQTTTIFTTVDFGFDPQADIFTFVPPPDAKEVAELPEAFPKPATATNTPPEPTPAEKIAAEHLGKQLPEVMLVDAGKVFSLASRYVGHPLLIDLWATWCGPCVSELPALNNIRKSTAQTDLKIIGIDEDSKPGVASELLQRRGYDWDDFHYTHALTLALPTTGIPLIVLVDSSGKIVYYHIGADDVKGLVAAVAKLGTSYASVSAEK